MMTFLLKKGSAETLSLTEPSRTERFGSSFGRTFRPNLRFVRPLVGSKVRLHSKFSLSSKFRLGSKARLGSKVRLGI